MPTVIRSQLSLMPRPLHGTNYRIQLASDVQRDGLGCELVDADGGVVAEAFRWDGEHRVTVLTDISVDKSALDLFLITAERELILFEDGRRLPPVKEWSFERRNCRPK